MDFNASVSYFTFLYCVSGVYTIQPTSTSFPFEKNLVWESRQFLLCVGVAVQILIECFIVDMEKMLFLCCEDLEKDELFL